VVDTRDGPLLHIHPIVAGTIADEEREETTEVWIVTDDDDGLFFSAMSKEFAEGVKRRCGAKRGLGLDFLFVTQFIRDKGCGLHRAFERA
jgi:hypothetical protein